MSIDLGTALIFVVGAVVGGAAATVFLVWVRKSGHRLSEPLIERAIQVHPAGVSAVLNSLQQLAVWAEIQRPSLRSVADEDGQVTLLFTDIERSTELNEMAGDERWLELLRRHNATIREAADAEGGFEVKSQGDGFMFAFADPDAALRCAIAVQRQLDLADDSIQGERLRVRMGVHTGQAIAEQGDLFGLTVIVAARITELAEGGQVLVSGATRERLTDEFELIDAGDVRLRGITGSRAVFSVAIDERDRPRGGVRALGLVGWIRSRLATS